MNSIAYREDIFDRFKDVFEKDQSFIEDWIVSWEYQEKRKRRQVNYGEGLPEEFYVFDGPQDIIQWVNWMLNTPKENFIRGEEFNSWSEKSLEYDLKVLKDLDFQPEKEVYLKGLGTYNAQDFFYANMIPYPNEGELKVLDFGAGYGRQTNLWMQNKPETVYVGMDAIPKSYCLQHFYYSRSKMLRQDYAIDPDQFSLEGAEAGIHHLPTWRWDLLPDNYFDRILLVQVLQEMNTRLVKEMMKTFHRVLKPGGALFIRDNDTIFRPVHRMDTNKMLEDAGFTLEFRAHLGQKTDIHGIPRIWRKTRAEVVKSEQITMDQRMKEWMMDVDALTKGKLKKVVKKVKGQ